MLAAIITPPEDPGVLSVTKIYHYYTARLFHHHYGRQLFAIPARLSNWPVVIG